MKHTFVLMLICFGSLVKGASKYYDGENRPYEFGYNIEGNQHRHEKKEDNGIITGEFGFITADGVYHVTAYATDEDGNFKILFMKNIKIGLPGEPGSKPVPKELQPELPVRITPRSDPISLNPSDIRACSGCSIPKKDGEKSETIPLSGRDNISKEPSITGKSSAGVPSGRDDELSTDTPLFRPLSRKIESNEIPSQRRPAPGSRQSSKPNSNQNSLPGNQQSIPPTSNRGTQLGNQPILMVAGDGVNQSGRDSPIGQAKVGTPGGSASRPIIGDMSQLGGITGPLYKFNYTVGYHGHHEQGDTVGAKDGGYFFVGRDGYKRTVDYQANEFGYQPHLVQDTAKTEDIPRPETEKERGLQGYEFKWFNLNKI